ncbi:2929_t:CDS:2 [Cetraspora pellucida]|uniref:Phosphatidate cytidylyltransferase, mitochondrial n=1 Tax=Cetraspora pellucida TaxID=1433469 RepID=A0A9N9EHF3_9GLOM|nr:2929_t:CDS:2 [Cetraspora pellucida]
MLIHQSTKFINISSVRFLSTTLPKAVSLARPTSPESAKSTPYDSSQHQNKEENSFPLSPNFGKNQHLPIDDEFKESLKKILFNFNAPIRYSFAYGSGVFPQKGYELEPKPMVDFIFAVSHPQHWHSLNLNRHRNHYSFMGTLGSRAVSILQNDFGAGIYFNPQVKMNGTEIKYGVISVDKLCKDLIDWETLYVAGRMHKPVKILQDDARVRLSQQVNLANALRTALLMLPKDFSEEQLYSTIAGISYEGDFRKFIGENPHKIKNIVSKQAHTFKILYEPLIEGFPNVSFVNNGKLQQDDNPKARAHLLSKLPRVLRNKIREQYGFHLIRKGQTLPSDEKEVYRGIASSDEYVKFVKTGLREIIFRPAVVQSIKGILTAGVIKSSKYTANKLGKWISRPQ